jgi:hypothetical protein
MWPKSHHDAYGFGAEGGCKDLLLSTHQGVEIPRFRYLGWIIGLLTGELMALASPKLMKDGSVQQLLSLEHRPPPLCHLDRSGVEGSLCGCFLLKCFPTEPPISVPSISARLKIFGKCIGAPWCMRIQRQ